MTPETDCRPFAWSEILDGRGTGWDAPTLRAKCGEPDQCAADGNGGAIWVYRTRRHPSPGALGDPRATEVQAWLMGGRVALLWLRLEFADGLTYEEVICRGSSGA